MRESYINGELQEMRLFGNYKYRYVVAGLFSQSLQLRVFERSKTVIMIAEISNRFSSTAAGDIHKRS